MTPCEERGWKVGDRFKRIGSRVYEYNHAPGDILRLTVDDGGRFPFFYNETQGQDVCCDINDLMQLEEKITLRPGDYVNTDGMTEMERREIVQGFLDAGAPIGEGFDYISSKLLDKIGWHKYHGIVHAVGCSTLSCGLTRRISREQLLGIATEWNGTGLPPVGAVVEYVRIGSAESKWWACTIIAHDNGAPVVRILDSNNYAAKPLSQYKFRSIRTERQRLAEQLQSDANLKPKPPPV